MKTILSTLALLAVFTSPAIAATQSGILGGEFNLNLASPNMMAKEKLGTKVLRETLRSIELVYNFATAGGAVGAIPLVNTNGNAVLTLASSLPKGAIVRNCVIDVVTAPTSGGSATIAFSTGQTAADLKTATAIGSLTAGLYACIPVGSAATSIKLTADSSPAITVATAALTAGLIHVIIDYSLSI